jgi:hypothetical protein
MSVTTTDHGAPLPALNALPMLFAVAWWNEMLRFWCGACMLHAPHPAERPFAVPNCLEEGGEHALFA